MPNWVANKMVFENDDDLLRFVNKYCVREVYDDAGNYCGDKYGLNLSTVDEIDELDSIYLDFNKAKKMPAVLGISSGSATAACKEVVDDFQRAGVVVNLENINFLRFKRDLAKVYGSDFVLWDKKFAPLLYGAEREEVVKLIDVPEIAKEMPMTNAIFSDKKYSDYNVFSDKLSAKSFTSLSEKEFCRVFVFAMELGTMMLKSAEKYGACDWYAWSCNNWGTKWNAHDCYVCTSDHCIGFQTAWNMPDGVYVEMAAQNPDVYFEIKWADEDTGYNVGHGYNEGGNFSYDYYDDTSKDAYEVAANLWGFDLEEEGYKFSEEQNTYIYEDDEE